MTTELEKHFRFWSDKINAIHGAAVESLKALGQGQAVDKVVFTELQHSIHPLMPKSQKPLIENKEIELQLLNLQL